MSKPPRIYQVQKVEGAKFYKPPFNDFLIEAGTIDQAHSGRTLHEHLVGTWTLLTDWHCSVDICNAGLFHSIYGTATFKPKTVSIDDRDVIQEMIGDRAENLVHLFCTTDSPRYINFLKMKLQQSDLCDLMTIEYANMIDQNEEGWDDSSFHHYVPSISIPKSRRLKFYE
jgi:hypothetical protein